MKRLNKLKKYYPNGGQMQDQEDPTMQLIQAYAQASQLDPIDTQSLIEQIQGADPETQQQMLMQMQQELQGGQEQQFAQGGGLSRSADYGKPYYSEGNILEGEFDVENISKEEIENLKNLGYNVEVI